MKPTNTQIINRKSGMTLLELTVVILVLLSLIAILFVGARAWKKGSDRSANIMNIRNAQQAMRGHANMRELLEGDNTVTEAVIYGANGDGIDGYLRKPVPPNSDIASYTGTGVVGAPGDLWLTVAYNGTGAVDYAPATTLTADW